MNSVRIDEIKNPAFMKIILFWVLSLSFFNLGRTEELHYLQPFGKSNNYPFPTDHFTNELFRKGLMVSSLHTFIPIGTGVLLMTLTSDSQNDYKTAGKFLFGYGLLLGPSMGHFYLKNAKRGYTGLLIRSLGTLIIAGAAIGVGVSGLCEDDCYADDILNDTCQSDCPSDAEITRTFLSLAIPSAALISWSIIKGFLSLKKSAKELHEKNEKLGLFLKPGNGFKSLQIQLTYSF